VAVRIDKARQYVPARAIHSLRVVRRPQGFADGRDTAVFYQHVAMKSGLRHAHDESVF
jgi:hypothetical protein